MPDIFGLNLAKIIDDSIVKAGGTNTGVLIKTIGGVRTPGNLTGGTNNTTQNYDFRGFRDNSTNKRRSGETVKAAGETVSIFGNSLPAGVEPEANDKVTIEGITFEVLEVKERDPAAALYVLEVKR